MSLTLSSLIQEVESRSPSPAPLDLLATASSTVEQVGDTTDALLSHFVDRSRRSGHSWTEIGAALGVTKQAVQKRFTGERAEPRDWERFTPRARSVVETHACAVASELGHNYIGTEHLLAGMWGEPEGIGTRALDATGLTRAAIVVAIDARVARGQQGRGGYTPRAWVAIENSSRIAQELGHNFVGTEHLLLSLMSGVGGMAVEILTEKGVAVEDVRSRILDVLGEVSSNR
jgi:Clp amino terminal domain, pathogenicity island component